jgi:hypothetical protein
MTTRQLATSTRNSATESISDTGAASRFAVLFVASARTDGGAWEDCTDEPPRVASRRVTWCAAVLAAIIINGVFVAAFAAKIAAFVAVAAR